MKKIIFILCLFAFTAIQFETTAQTLPAPNASGSNVVPGVGVTNQYYINKVQPYKKRISRITQSSTTAPADTVLESNFPATGTWRYVSTGVYNLRCTGCFSTTKTSVEVTSKFRGFGYFYSILSTDSIALTIDSVNAVTNGMLSNSKLEIRTYP